MLIELIERIVKTGPRCIRLVADAGWGKTTFARTYLSAQPVRSATIECRPFRSVADFEAAVCRALGVLGMEAEPATLEAAWSAPGPPSLVVIDAARVLIGIEHAVDLLRTLLRTVPENRTLIICSRIELPIVWSAYFAPHEMATLGPNELAIDDRELAIILGSIAASERLKARIIAVSHGWPIAALLLTRLAAVDALEPALDQLADATTFGDLHAYVQAEIFADLSESELDTLCVIAGFEEIATADVSIALGRNAEAELDALSGRMRYLVIRENDTYRPLPLALAAAEAMQRPRTQALLLRASDRFAEIGRFVRAADAALRGGDVTRARIALDATGAPAPAFRPTPLYMCIALALGIDELARARNILAVLLSCRMPATVTMELGALVDQRWKTLEPSDDNLHLRTVLRVARASLLQYAGRFDEAMLAAKGAERDIATIGDDTPIATALRVARAVLATNFMRLDEAEAAWQRGGESTNPAETYYAFERNFINLSTAIASGSRRTVATAFAAAIDEVALSNDDASRAQLGMYVASASAFSTGRFPETDAAQSFASSSARFGTDDLERLRLTRDSTLPLEPLSRMSILAMIDSALQLNDRAASIELMHATVAAADTLSSPLYQVIARVVNAALDEREREKLTSEALELAPVPAYRERVLEIRNGVVSDDSVFAPFVKGLMDVGTYDAGPPYCIEVMRGIVMRRGSVVRLRAREHELLIALALAPQALLRETLIERMWPDQEESVSAGSLRSTLHRLRQQLGDAGIIVREGNRYRLSELVAVDIIEAEALYHGLRLQTTPITVGQRARLEAQFEALAFGIPDAYVRWAWFASVESRLTDLRHDLGMLLTRDDFHNERYAAAARWAERLIALDPLDDAAAGLLFLSIAQSGGKPEAMRWMRNYRDLLAREYAMEPSFELERVVRGDLAEASAQAT